MPIAPNLSRPGNGSKDPSLPNTGCSCPLIEGYFDPFWNRHGADVATLTNEIHHCPVPLAHLDFIQLQAHKFRSAKTTTEQHGQHRVVALRSHAIPTQETKQMANQISEPVDLWDLEHYLTQRRKEIDRKYDYRYSQLTQVFGKLLYESRLGEEDLRGLREDKLRSIRSFAKFLAEMDVA